MSCRKRAVFFMPPVVRKRIQYRIPRALAVMVVRALYLGLLTAGSIRYFFVNKTKYYV